MINHIREIIPGLFRLLTDGAKHPLEAMRAAVEGTCNVRWLARTALRHMPLPSPSPPNNFFSSLYYVLRYLLVLLLLCCVRLPSLGPPTKLVISITITIIFTLK